jgi:hypothetical protein
MYLPYSISFCLANTKNAISLAILHLESRNSAVGTAASYRLDGWGSGVRVPVGVGFLSSPRLPGRFWGPPSLLSNRYRAFYPRRWSGRGVKLTTHELVPRSRILGSIHPLPTTSSWRNDTWAQGQLYLCLYPLISQDSTSVATLSPTGSNFHCYPFIRCVLHCYILSLKLQLSFLNVISHIDLAFHTSWGNFCEPKTTSSKQLCYLCFHSQDRIYTCGGPGETKMRRPPSVTTNLGYDISSSVFLTSYNN